MNPDKNILPIGLFFGSFNPIHNGHLSIADYVLTQRYCSEVWFVISPCNPFKKDRSLLDEGKRLYLVQMAIKGNHSMVACDAEFGMPKPSYTADTLRLLKEIYPEKKFIIIIGEDNVVGFDNWKDARHILDNYNILVYPRQDTQHVDLENPAFQFIQAPLFPYSSTEIRERIKKGESIEGLVPNSIEELCWQLYS